MSLTIIEPELERRLEALGKRQPVPVSKHAMARAILAAALADGRGAPVDKWRHASQAFVDQLTDSPDPPKRAEAG